MKNNQKITVQIPTLNEEKCLEYAIKDIPRDIVDEILIIDGHSTDRTKEIAERMGCNFLLQPKKRGYGDAMKFGFKNATGDVIIDIDADGSYEPKDILRLLDKMQEGNYDMVLGSRYCSGARSDDDTFIRKSGNKIFTFLTNLLFGSHFTDSLFLFMAVKKDKLLQLDLKSDDFALCIEIIVKAHQAGFKIAEIPCVERPRFADESRVNAFTDGLKIIWQMFKWRFKI